MTPKSKLNKHQNTLLIIIFLLVLVFVLVEIRISVPIGEHSYRGGIFDTNTKEQIDTVSVQLSGKRIYSINPKVNNFCGEITIQGSDFQITREVMTHLSGYEKGWLRSSFPVFGPNGHMVGKYQEHGILLKDNYSLLIIPLSFGTRSGLLAVSEGNQDKLIQIINDYCRIIE